MIAFIRTTLIIASVAGLLAACGNTFEDARNGSQRPDAAADAVADSD